MSELETLLLLLIRHAELLEPVYEYRFHPKRRWRFDFAYPDKMIAIECEGGTWSGGRHTRGGGFENDCEKYNTAALMGWKVLRFTRAMIENGVAVDMIGRALKELDNG